MLATDVLTRPARRPDPSPRHQCGGLSDAARQDLITYARLVNSWLADTALTGTPDPPCGWLDMVPEANQRAGGLLRWKVGYQVTHVLVDGLMP